MAKLKTLPLLRMVEWLGKNEVRLFFATGKSIRIVKMALPGVRSAKHAHVVDQGMGLDFGNGREVSSWDLWEMPGKIIPFPRKAPPRKTSARRTSRQRR